MIKQIFYALFIMQCFLAGVTFMLNLAALSNGTWKFIPDGFMLVANGVFIPIQYWFYRIVK